jgi:hypothetical protein
MRKNTLMTILEKKNGQIDYVTAADKIKYEAFINNLPEGYKLEVYMEVQSDDGSLAQLAKIHAMIRELSQHIGETFEDMKLIVKRRAGICIEKEIEGETFLYCKSFGKCSKEELSLVIETIVSIGQAIDYPIG